MFNKFNTSYSVYDTYLKSPLWFYFMKLSKEKPSNKVIQVYGDAGNVVHNAGEDYWNSKEFKSFFKHWQEYKIDDQRGFRGAKLNFNNYYSMFKKLIEFMDRIIYDKATTELKIEKKLIGMNFKAFIDLYTEVRDEIVIYDWKTDSTHNYNKHLKQRLIYSWLIWKTKGIIPTCHWVYLKDMDIINDKFTVKQLEEFEQELHNFRDEILQNGMDINKYEAGNYKSPFNTYLDLCQREVNRRNTNKYIDINLNIKGNFVFFEGDIDPILLQGVDINTKFDLPDKYWMQKKVKEKNPGADVSDVGTTHLFNRKFRCFPIGLMDEVVRVCHEYGEYYNKEVKIFVHDSRDQTVMNQGIKGLNSELLKGVKLRGYQYTGVVSFLTYGSGILAMATGSGKTITAAEIIRTIMAKTLWIIDRKELLSQTKKELQSLLGIEIGEICGGRINIQDVTIATVQSLSSRLDELRDYLYSVNFAVVDEYHKSAAESYQKIFARLPNTKYRLGLTATPYRDDGKTPILFSILGKVIYSITTMELVKLGYLVRPTIEFYELPYFAFEQDTYKKDYKNNIVENTLRNTRILDICCINKNKKILILTKLVNHGQALKKHIFNSAHLHGLSKNREKIMDDFRNGETNVLIMTLSIGAEGLDIPDLDIIINASGNKGDVKSIQVLGRVLRIFKDKKDALYIDFLDGGKYTRKHSEMRMKAFEGQGHEVVLK